MRFGDWPEDRDSVPGDPQGSSGNDALVGGYGDNLLQGGAGNDYLYGDIVELEGALNPGPLPLMTEPAVSIGDGKDVLSGGGGNDYLHGGEGINILDGGPGNDTLVSEGDYDILIGGTGRDVFDVTAQEGTVKIMDFNPGEGQLRFELSGDMDDIYQIVAQAGMEWDWEWFATEVEDGVVLDLENVGGYPAYNDGALVVIEDVALADLHFQSIGDGVFIA